jgi:predicted nucleotidyltransferase
MIKITNKLTEASRVLPNITLITPGPDAIPTDREINRFAEMYVDCLLNKNAADIYHQPWRFAQVTKDAKKKLHRFILSIMVDWKDFTNTLSKVLLRDGYEKAELKACLDYVAQSPEMGKITSKLNEEIKKAYTKYTVRYSSTTESLDEDIEKHEELNPKLFEGNALKPDIKEKMLEIVQEFVSGLEQDQLGIKVDDILFLGSNASYNYTKDSDIDLHIIVDPKELNCSEEISAALYGAYRSLFNNKLDIDFYGIPVELYVETPDTKRVSNGVYSVMNDAWVKEPEMQDIPEIDMDAFKAEYDVWEAKCKDIKENAKNKSSVTSNDVDTLINEIYEQRKAGLAEGEYSIGNLIFKELRNVGLLDELKDLKNELRGKELSLKESFKRSRIRIKNNKRAD